MTKPKALVMYGDGINCDAETEFGLQLAGFNPNRVHTSELLTNPKSLNDCKLLVFPGGFSFGDEIASGKVLALELKQRVNEALHQFIDNNGFVLGICNGFQVLVQLGILPISRQGSPRIVSLTRNSAGKFINKWVTLSVAGEKACFFFDGLKNIDLPIRHGEGRLSLGAHPDKDVVMTVSRHTVLRYREDINGSFEKAAALTNENGNVLGLMPHPEAFVRWSQHPGWPELNLKASQSEDANETPHGLAILQNAFRAVN